MPPPTSLETRITGLSVAASQRMNVSRSCDPVGRVAVGSSSRTSFNRAFDSHRVRQSMMRMGTRRAQHQMSNRFHVVTPLQSNYHRPPTIARESSTCSLRRSRLAPSRPRICNTASTHAGSRKARWANSCTHRNSAGADVTPSARFSHLQALEVRIGRGPTRPASKGTRPCPR